MEEKDTCECGCGDCEHMGIGSPDDQSLTPEELASVLAKEQDHE